MINTEVGEMLVEYSKHIARWAKRGDTSMDEATPVTTRAHENAWRLLSFLITFSEHAKESDMYWKLLAIAQERKKSKREQDRLLAIAKQEDRGYMRSKVQLEKMLAEMLQAERDNPKALREEQLAVLAKAKKSVRLVGKSTGKNSAEVATASETRTRKSRHPTPAPLARVAKKSKLPSAKSVTISEVPLGANKVSGKTAVAAKKPKA